MSYKEYQDIIKVLNISSVKFTKIIGVSETTPPAVWKKKGIVPIIVERFLELLEKMPEDERVLFIHHKLKESNKSE
jgi:hypothetical protein